MNGEVRAYRPGDRPAVRHICCETGFMGAPIEPFFSDRDVFADFFTRYYTDVEPAAALVAERDGRVGGYVLGCLRPGSYPLKQAIIMVTRTAPKIVGRILRGRYGRSDRRFMWWIMTRARRETPRVPPRLAHFHINLLPDFRDGRLARRLVFTFLERARAAAVPGVFGQIQTFDDRRSNALFERYGFLLYDRRRVTRFAHLNGKDVYVSTFYQCFDRSAA